ncbi:D-alanyl-D-alanine carboxypeptidase [Companilactobacillus allii]|uniref:D-alanyl-D-alanine carboxypeptidase n=1 Tax=Companilactobacillus allii TaxID=1847728 RepID=A0A1P8Q0V9_9LACO|nr:D-alanyl-D-alanine carboxypeptidase family protein [Companilactobacillus allii]APX71512.1 D-alanyl-D-alanine carboxypeptidase [Companilactobacillus allii]USQ68593.1 D-alanyl-D-alanine carboxypeptidase [Companilactobacillus allii]
MKKIIQKLLLLASVMILIPVFQPQTVAAATEPELNAKAAMAFDEKTGQIMYSKNTDEKVAIGSITKIITLYLVTKAIDSGELKETDMLTPTKEQADMTQEAELTNVRLDADKTYSVKNLYSAAWIVSSNSAAMMLAQKVSGNQKSFVRLMRRTLKDWGINDAKIYNVSGLNNDDLYNGMYLGNKDNENKLSVNDIAIIVKHILDEYPEVLKTTSQAKLEFPVDGETKTYNSLNLLLKDQRDYQEGYEFDGLKTGTTKKAGESFVGTLPMDGTRVVTIVMDVTGDESDNDKRFRSTQNLARYVKENYTRTKIMTPGDKVDTKYTPQKDVYMWLPSDFDLGSLKYEKSKNDLGFKTTYNGKTVKLNAINSPNGYIPYTKTEKKIKIKKVATKTTNWWDNVVHFFTNLF